MSIPYFAQNSFVRASPMRAAPTWARKSPPLIGHPDAPPAHPEHVADLSVAAVNPHGREDQPTLLVDVPGVGHVGRRLSIAAVRLVRLGSDRVDVGALVEHRHEHRVVGGVRVPQVRVVVQEGVALLDVVVQVVIAWARNSIPITWTGRPSAEASSRLSAVMIGRRSLAPCSGLPSDRWQERVLHLTDDRFEPVRDHREKTGSKELRRASAPWSTSTTLDVWSASRDEVVPERVTRTEQPG